MIFTSALCFVLVLTYTSASTSAGSKAKAEALSEKIASAVAGELVQVAKAAKGTDTAELNKKLLETTRAALKRMAPELEELSTLSGKSKEQIAKDLTYKINLNKALRDMLPKDAKISSRSIAQLVVGPWGVAMQGISG